MNVLIAGGGTAALEAALALRRLAGDRVAVTVLAPEAEFNYRPRSVLSPFAAGGATRYPLARIAADAGFTHVRDRLASVDTAEHTVVTVTGEQIPYGVLLVASGARPVEALPGAVTFTGSLTDQERVHGIVQDVEAGYVRRVAFVVPAAATWPLPLYELALMLAERADSMGMTVALDFVTPEAEPLRLIGVDAATLLTEAGVTVRAGTHADVVGPGRLRLVPGDVMIETDRIVTLPRLVGPAISGLPADADGFLVTDNHGRVTGVPDVYAAGDVTAFPIKQGGIACQQADAAAADIAARAGADVVRAPFRPRLDGVLLTRDTEHVDTKIFGRELPGYLRELDREAVAR
jgi:sulfide:quinone oxidoreductase